MDGQYSRKGKEVQAPEQTRTPAAGPALAAESPASSQVFNGSRPQAARPVMSLEEFKTFLATEKVLWEDPTARSFDEHGNPVFRPDLHRAILRQKELLWPQQQQQQQQSSGLNLLRGPQPWFSSQQMVEGEGYTPQFLTHQAVIQVQQGNADPGFCGHYDAALGGQPMNGGGGIVGGGSFFEQGADMGAFSNDDPSLLNGQGHTDSVQDAFPLDQDDSSNSHLPPGGWQI
ncbi:hypothetical protein CTA1_9161 [Colletotrichum tanaceti]|uniref:Uncharacterized protein n=1 Tax=Colletotrichum tanaceti TaxID=1306861 RepID=A0A4U6XPK2_9PEZI|nr:hypothetical protein CTA1_9161 [Colletotrichum tanaceti]